MRITGIWKVREKELARIKTERAKIKKEEAQFKLQKAELVKDTVRKTAQQYQAKFDSLKRNERKVKAEASKKIAAAMKDAHSKAELKSKLRMVAFEKRMNVSMKRQSKVLQAQAKAEAKQQYKGIERTLKANVMQFKSQSKKLQSQNAKQEVQIERLQKRLEDQKTPQEEGFLNEKELMAKLEEKFKNTEDTFKNTGKGGDIIQSVVKDKKEIGIIVYECKDVKHYSSKHVKQTWEAQRKRKADFGVLETNAMKKGTNGFFIERGVIVVHSTAVLYVAAMLRGQIVQLSEMKLGQAEKEKAVKNILNYLESPDFTNSVSSIVQDSITLYKGLMEEIKKHSKMWKERYSLYSKINEEATAIQSNTKALLSGKEKQEKRVSMLPALVELPETDDKEAAL